MRSASIQRSAGAGLTTDNVRLAPAGPIRNDEVERFDRLAATRWIRNLSVLDTASPDQTAA